MYGLMTERGEPPTVEQNTLFVQRVGRRDFSFGNSCRSRREDRPFTRRTNGAIPYCGSTSQRICTWSGITSISRISERVSSATPAMISLSRASIGGVRTLRRYFGQNTTWRLHEYVQLLFDLKARSIQTLYHSLLYNALGDCAKRKVPNVLRTLRFCIPQPGMAGD